MSNRKAFNFLKSYYDVYNKLKHDKDKKQFIEALMERMFYGVEPKELSDMADFAYTSQQHAIDKSVKGFEDKTGVALKHPSQDPSQGGSQDPSQQEQGEEEEQEKGEGELDPSFPPPLSLVEEYFLDNGYTKESAKKAFDYYNASLTGGKRKWTDSKGNVVKNWKQKMRSVWFKEENKVKPKASSNTFVNSQGQTINKNAW